MWLGNSTYLTFLNSPGVELISEETVFYSQKAVAPFLQFKYFSSYKNGISEHMEMLSNICLSATL